MCIVKKHGLQLLRIYSTIHLTTSLLRYGYLADAGKRALHAQNRLPHRILIVSDFRGLNAQIPLYGLKIAILL